MEDHPKRVIALVAISEWIVAAGKMNDLTVADIVALMDHLAEAGITQLARKEDCPVIPGTINSEVEYRLSETAAKQLLALSSELRVPYNTDTLEMANDAIVQMQKALIKINNLIQDIVCLPSVKK
jgi:hypothetical protein